MVYGWPRCWRMYPLTKHWGLAPIPLYLSATRGRCKIRGGWSRIIALWRINTQVVWRLKLAFFSAFMRRYINCSPCFLAREATNSVEWLNKWLSEWCHGVLGLSWVEVFFEITRCLMTHDQSPLVQNTFTSFLKSVILACGMHEISFNSLKHLYSCCLTVLSALALWWRQDKWIHWQVIFCFVQLLWQINFNKLFQALLLCNNTVPESFVPLKIKKVILAKRDVLLQKRLAHTIATI